MKSQFLLPEEHQSFSGAAPEEFALDQRTIKICGINDLR
jgi:hypothetical protein